MGEVAEGEVAILGGKAERGVTGVRRGEEGEPSDEVVDMALRRFWLLGIAMGCEWGLLERADDILVSYIVEFKSRWKGRDGGGKRQLDQLTPHCARLIASAHVESKRPLS